MVMDSEETRRLFSKIARRYDFLNHFLSLNLDRYWRDELVKHAILGYDSSINKILDACTGTCDIAIRFAERGYEVVGVDFSEEMLRIGKRKVRRRKIQDKITLIKGDALNLPFKDGMFDIVTVAFGLRNMNDYKRGIEEMKRVAREGGKILILDFSTPQNLFSPFYRFYLRRILPLIGGLFSGSKSAYTYLPNSIFEFSKMDILKLMEDAGLKNLYRRRLTAGVASLYVGEK
ncbi:MAG: bifunctional demethylmenaquinone methyltransferase/2-methoxy-6-polyprenyl-1,4-benzoquinol methylase UbiE [Candidatus Methanospirareceae archaeon]